MIIFLVGYMGCGKSSIGRALASRLNIQFLDMDPLIEQHCGKSIREIFASEGEEGFRLHEKEVLAELVAEQQECIVATGGGAPCFYDNMEVMNRAGVTVYFQMSPEKLAGRLEHGKADEARVGEHAHEEVERSLVARHPQCETRQRGRGEHHEEERTAHEARGNAHEHVDEQIDDHESERFEFHGGLS